MDGRAVTLMIRYKDAGGTWRQSRNARGGDGRVKPGHARVGGKAVPVENVTYELRHMVDRRTVYTPVGKRAAVADAKRVQLENTKSILAQALRNLDVEMVENTDRATLKDTAAAYVKDAEGRNAREAAPKSRLVTVAFMSLLRTRKKLCLDQIVRNDFFTYHYALRAGGIVRLRTITRGWRRGYDSAGWTERLYRRLQNVRTSSPQSTRRIKPGRC